MGIKDTIFALSTPRGRSAIALFRVSGKNSHKIINKISTNKFIETQKSKLNYILDKKKKPIDQTITTYFKAPNSFTGENMVEISCHGSLAVIKKITEEFKKNGMRIADPGEFTRRSLENNKLDLVKIEGLGDLINSKTEKQREIAFKGFEGEINDFLLDTSNKIKKMLADIEALIDFSDEDLPKNIVNSIKEQNKNIINNINKTIKYSDLAKSIRSGFLVSVIGAPNTGKSSFVNFVSGRDVSIVTKIPGTTTDLIESHVEIRGYEVIFVDTAGIRKHRNQIEKIGIEKSINASKRSDLNLVFLKNNEIKKYSNTPNKIFVKSKQDKRQKTPRSKVFLNISSKTGYGIDNLLREISKKLLPKNIKEVPIISRERQLEKIQKCKKHLELIDFDKNIDMLAYDARSALNELQNIYNKFDIEEILDIIFNDFCIGK